MSRLSIIARHTCRSNFPLEPSIKDWFLPLCRDPLKRDFGVHIMLCLFGEFWQKQNTHSLTHTSWLVPHSAFDASTHQMQNRIQQTWHRVNDVWDPYKPVCAVEKWYTAAKVLHETRGMNSKALWKGHKKLAIRAWDASNGRLARKSIKMN